MKKSKYMQVLAACVASGSSVRDAAKVAGCTESTAYAISCQPEFKESVAKLRTEAVSQAVSVLSTTATKAVSTLAAMLDEKYDPNVRLNAAKAILTNLGPLTELGELRARVDAIEASKLKVAR